MLNKVSVSNLKKIKIILTAENSKNAQRAQRKTIVKRFVGSQVSGLV